MLLPVTLLIAMFRLIDSLLTLDLVFTTTFGGPGFATHTLSFWIYQQGLRYFNISYAAAMSWILLVGCMMVAGGVPRLASARDALAKRARRMIRAAFPSVALGLLRGLLVTCSRPPWRWRLSWCCSSTAFAPTTSSCPTRPA